MQQKMRKLWIWRWRFFSSTKPFGADKWHWFFASCVVIFLLVSRCLSFDVSGSNAATDFNEILAVTVNSSENNNSIPTKASINTPTVENEVELLLDTEQIPTEAVAVVRNSPRAVNDATLSHIIIKQQAVSQSASLKSLDNFIPNSNNAAETSLEIEQPTALTVDDNDATTACGRFCVCSRTTANCSSRNLQDMPAALPRTDTIQHLDLSYNRFTAVPAGIIQEIFSHLKTLNLSNNLVEYARKSDLLPGVFSTLERLDLSHNHIAHLPPFTFSTLNNLLHLNLANNKLTRIDSDVYDSIKQLQVLNLQGNEIKSYALPLKCPSLRELQLSYNNMNNIDADVVAQQESMPLLRVLNLSHNRLADDAVMPLMMLKPFPSLRVFDISHNRLTKLPTFIFDATQNSKPANDLLINISSNSIATLNLTELLGINISSRTAGAAASVIQIDVSDNVWLNCSCEQLQWLQLLRQQNTLFDFGVSVCPRAANESKSGKTISELLLDISTHCQNHGVLTTHAVSFSLFDYFSSLGTWTYAAILASLLLLIIICAIALWIMCRRCCRKRRGKNSSPSTTLLKCGCCGAGSVMTLSPSPPANVADADYVRATAADNNGRSLYYSRTDAAAAVMPAISAPLLQQTLYNTKNGFYGQNNNNAVFDAGTLTSTAALSQHYHPHQNVIYQQCPRCTLRRSLVMTTPISSASFSDNKVLNSAVDEAEQQEAVENDELLLEEHQYEELVYNNRLLMPDAAGAAVVAKSSHLVTEL